LTIYKAVINLGFNYQVGSKKLIIELGHRPYR
jgi:hypothetical protein